MTQSNVSDVPWYIMGSIIAGAVAIISSLLALYLRSIKHCVKNLGANLTTRLNRQDLRIEKCESTVNDLNQTISKCKLDCERNTVSKEEWVRSEAFTRNKLDGVTALLSRIEGNLHVVEKIPTMVGAIVREVVSQLKTGG